MHAAYRAVRITLLSKGLLSPGESLYEAVVEKFDGDILTQRASVRQDSTLGAIAGEAHDLPTVATDDLSPDETKSFAAHLLYAAIQAGYDPNDECLHWFHPDLIEEFWPSAELLLRFEERFLQRVGKVLVSRGRQRAMNALTKVLGEPASCERKDWGALPMAYVRNFLEGTTEDDRTLVVARLEVIASKARNELDLKTEMQAVKMIAQVKGLLFNDADGRSQRALAMLFAGGGTRSLESAVVRDTAETRKLTG